MAPLYSSSLNQLEHFVFKYYRCINFTAWHYASAE